MQGDQAGNRRVLWNFDNVRSGGIGTVEFRGGPVLHNATQTIHWILFAVGFILLAIDEVCDPPLSSMLDLGAFSMALLTRLQDKLCTGDFSYVEPGTPLFWQRAIALWSRIRGCARRKVTEKRTLPHFYKTMNENGLNSGVYPDSETDELEADESEADDPEADESDADESDGSDSYSDDSD